MGIFCLLLLAFTPMLAAEADAIAISENIQHQHLPYGVIADPVFAAPNSDQIVNYTRCGDAAIWTGHYLAAESFRYAATRSPQALTNARRALAGIRSLVDVTGTNLLARCIVPVDSPYATGIMQEEAQHGTALGTLEGRPYFWIGNTSRDQYSGVYFGLGVAYDLLDDPGARDSARALVTRLTDFLLDHNWAVVMPDGQVSTVFWGRTDQQLALLKIAERVNPNRFSSTYKWMAWSTAATTVVPIAIEVLDKHHSYYKFNLDAINLYHLVRLEGNSFLRRFYKKAYDTLRNTVDDHGNAHFNMIDRAITGPNDAREAETRSLLQQWLARPRRDVGVDLRGVYAACDADDRACDPIPVPQRVTTGFLWERSPYLLHGGGDGFIEGTGIDYILPYWMARYHSVL